MQLTVAQLHCYTDFWVVQAERQARVDCRTITCFDNVGWVTRKASGCKNKHHKSQTSTFRRPDSNSTKQTDGKNAVVNVEN